MRYAMLLLLSILLLLTAGCTPEAAVPGGEELPVKVVTTIFPVADMVKELGGDQVSVSYLLPAGVSPHTYEPTVEQARKVAEADLFVCIGANLDNWALKLSEAAKPGLKVLVLADSITLPEIHRDQQNGSHDYPANPEHNNDHKDLHDRGPVDPHFWLDPVAVRDMICPALAAELAALAPDHAAHFEENLSNYSRELTLLHAEISSAVEAFNSRDFIVFHSAWQYFARRYGLNELAVIAEFPGQEPSAGWIAGLVKLAQEKNICAILTEPQFSPALAERVAEESGIAVLVADPLGGETVSGRRSYLQLMRYNLEVFKKAGIIL